MAWTELIGAAESIDALADTSVFVAAEQGRSLAADCLPSLLGISVVTLAELRLAVLNAPSPNIVALRLATLEKALTVQAVGIDERIAACWALLRSAARSESQSHVNDLWIAATALSLQVPVVTQDEGFLRLKKVSDLEVILI